MHIRLAALVIVIATLLLSFNSPSKSGPNYTQLAQSCLGNKGGTAHVIAACTVLMNGEGVTPENRLTLLKSRGWAYYSGKQYEKAISDYTSALALAQNDPRLTLWRAIAYNAAGDVQSAEAAYERALLLAPSSTDALFHKAQFDRGQGNTLAAIQGLEKVLELDPSYGDAGTALINAHYDVNGHDAVEQFLTQAEQRWTNQSWVHLSRLIYDLKFTGDLESALEASTALARLETGLRSELFLHALVHFKIGDTNKGEEYVENFAAHVRAEDSAKRKYFKRWFYSAAEWYVWRNAKEQLYRGNFYAILGQMDLAEMEYKAVLQRTGSAGRKALLDIYCAKGVSVSQQAYAGSSDHITQAISDYVRLVDEESFHHNYGPPKPTKGE
ncbi:tetratricopeptide repeat protein [Ruegeria atlantica]|uniref:tetratricopeptide repeat protein n=1 Tax=Ruegeria atlantica TaxID=81569 RepID=UPI0024945EF5|nr:tetratricopeptide repeat protein [Ruegeria atlantica]